MFNDELPSLVQSAIHLDHRLPEHTKAMMEDAYDRIYNTNVGSRLPREVNTGTVNGSGFGLKDLQPAIAAATLAFKGIRWGLRLLQR